MSPTDDMKESAMPPRRTRGTVFSTLSRRPRRARSRDYRERCARRIVSRLARAGAHLRDDRERRRLGDHGRLRNPRRNEFDRRPARAHRHRRRRHARSHAGRDEHHDRRRQRRRDSRGSGGWTADREARAAPRQRVLRRRASRRRHAARRDSVPGRGYQRNAIQRRRAGREHHYFAVPGPAGDQNSGRERHHPVECRRNRHSRQHRQLDPRAEHE